MVWLETPTNPTMKLIDIKAVSEIAKKHNQNIVIVADNTFASSYFQVFFTFNGSSLFFKNHSSYNFNRFYLEPIGIRC